MIYMFLADGFEEIEAVTPLDILRRAGAEIKTVGVGAEFVRGAHDIVVKTDLELSEVGDSFDMLIFPGGIPGTDNLAASEEIAELIKTADDKGKYIAAICAAPSIFGKMGLLKGKRAVCFPEYEKCLIGAEISDKPVEIDGNIITSRGAGTAAEFGFALVGVLYGEEKAGLLREKMQYGK